MQHTRSGSLPKHALGIFEILSLTMIRASAPPSQGSKRDTVISLGVRRGEHGGDVNVACHSAPGPPGGADVLIARAAAL